MRYSAKSFLLLVLQSAILRPGLALSIRMSNNNSSSGSRRIYGVPHSGWTSPQWNWGSAVGTGHDCARICRQQYDTPQARQEFIHQLLLVGQRGRLSDTLPFVDFEEVKLVLALTWQRGRWDGSDGGRGGYGDVLKYMAEAQRYEEGSEAECSRRLVQDMQTRFHLLRPSSQQRDAMASLGCDGDEIMDARYRCAGLVLQCRFGVTPRQEETMTIEDDEVTLSEYVRIPYHFWRLSLVPVTITWRVSVQSAGGRLGRGKHQIVWTGTEMKLPSRTIERLHESEQRRQEPWDNVKFEDGMLLLQRGDVGILVFDLVADR